jgi:hypothetical protein
MRKYTVCSVYVLCERHRPTDAAGVPREAAAAVTIRDHKAIN